MPCRTRQRMELVAATLGFAVEEGIAAFVWPPQHDRQSKSPSSSVDDGTMLHFDVAVEDLLVVSLVAGVLL